MNKIIQSIMLEQDTSNLALNTTFGNSLNESKVTLHQAIMDGRIQQIKYLIKMGCSIDAKDKYGRTCLMIACLCDHEQYGYRVAKLLLKCGADLNLQDTMGRSAISIAIAQKREKLVELFIVKNKQTVDFRLKDNDGNNILNHAAVYGTPNMIRLIIEQMKSLYIQIDQRNSLGYTALLLAIKHKRYLNAFILLTDGQASCFVKDGEHFLNALEWLTKDHANLNEFLIKQNQTHEQQPQQLTRKSLSRSNTITSTCSASNLRANPLGIINYKTWYNLPNQYHSTLNSLSKCEHVTYTNYSIDIQNSTYIPAILTPRSPQQQSQQLKPTHELTDNEVVFKLIEKIRQTMSKSNSPTNRHMNSASSNNNHEKEKSNSNRSESSSSQFKAYSQSKTILIDHFPTIKRERNVSIDTEKILNLTANQSKTIKDFIPKIMENYTGSVNRTRATNTAIRRHKSDRLTIKEAAERNIISPVSRKKSSNLTMLPNKPSLMKEKSAGSLQTNQTSRANKEVTFNLD